MIEILTLRIGGIRYETIKPGCGSTFNDSPEMLIGRNRHCSLVGYTFTEIHSYKEVLTDCPECDALGTLTKLLNTPVNLSYKQVQKTSKPGTVINDAILSTREEIEVHKKELESRKANHDG